MFLIYTQWVGNHPWQSAFFQFMLLGALGEMLPIVLRQNSLRLPFSKTQLLGKLLAWGLLGLLIQPAFLMMKGSAAAVMDKGLLPELFATGLGWAVLASVITNLFFGPQMMFFHRLEDNVILRERKWGGLEKAWWNP